MKEIIKFLFEFVDVDVEKPDEKSVMTYVAQFLKAYPEAGEDPSVSNISGLSIIFKLSNTSLLTGCILKFEHFHEYVNSTL